MIEIKDLDKRVVKHHKTSGRYLVLGQGAHTETGELLEAYLDLNGNLWLRPVLMFEQEGRFETDVLSWAGSADLLLKKLQGWINCMMDYLPNEKRRDK